MRTTEELERAIVEAIQDESRLASAIDALVGRLLSRVAARTGVSKYVSNT